MAVRWCTVERSVFICYIRPRGVWTAVFTHKTYALITPLEFLLKIWPWSTKEKCQLMFNNYNYTCTIYLKILFIFPVTLQSLKGIIYPNRNIFIVWNILKWANNVRIISLFMLLYEAMTEYQIQAYKKKKEEHLDIYCCPAFLWLPADPLSEPHLREREMGVTNMVLPASRGPRGYRDATPKPYLHQL